jgi:hypothetical protein
MGIHYYVYNNNINRRRSIMNKIKIFHEAPLLVMPIIQSMTDGDYCLPHLLDSNEEYRDYFLKAKENKRYIIMDNSVHELGKAYSKERLLYWIETLLPNEFIIPDELNEGLLSVRNAKEWSNIEIPDEVTKVAVVQGKSHSDICRTYQIYKDLGYQKIAFPYSSPAYLEHSDYSDQNMAKSLGRINMISKMYSTKLISSSDRIHLLGCYVPSEFLWYTNMPFIESLDTSNPVMASLDKIEYGTNIKKPVSNMNTHFLTKDFKISDIKNNINMFRKFNNL